MSDDGDVVRRAEERLGSVLRGKYRLDRVLGVGGMATVYAATHRNQAEFAVKLLHPELSLRADVRTRFLREGYVANSVKHPGAVRVVDDDVAEDGAAFLVMELLEGATVEALCERAGGKLPPRAAVAIVDQLLEVLCAAHAKGVIHRDIKPANLFVTSEASVKVLDFGIARARDAVAATGAHGGTGSGMILGTPAFMSPEQALAKASEIDAQTDVWAAGATLFSLVTGRTVHEGENGAQLMVRAATTPARSLAGVAPTVSQIVAEVVDRALAFRKADRWRSAAEMRDALRDAWQREAGQPPSRESLGPFLTAHASSSPQARSVAPAEATAVAPTERAPETPAPARTPPVTPPHTSRGPSTTEPVSGSAPRGDAASLPRHRGPAIAAIAVAIGVVLTGVVWAVAPRAHGPGAVPTPNATTAPSPPVPETVKLVEPAPQPITPSASSAPAPEAPHPAVSTAAVPQVSPRPPAAGGTLTSPSDAARRNGPPAQGSPRPAGTSQGGIPIQW